MIELETKLRKWGNSYGLVVPLAKLKTSNLKEGQEVTAIILEKKRIDLRKLFGRHKFSKSVEQLMKETDRELYNE